MKRLWNVRSWSVADPNLSGKVPDLFKSVYGENLASILPTCRILRRNTCSPCARGQIRAKSDPCSAVDFLPGTVRADFVLPDSSSFWSHFSAADCKTTKFSFKTLCCCAELPAKRLDSARESARYLLASSCSQHSTRRASSSFQQTIKKRKLL